MTTAIRWRIMSLQAILFVVLAAAAGFAFTEGSFVTNMIHDELATQQIYFPGADQIKPGGALDPKEFPQEIQDQAGKQVTDGNQARIYANDFIGKHLENIAGGRTYATQGTYISDLNAQLAATPKDSAQYTALQQQIAAANAARTTLFQGEALRGNLLNAYGWWTIGTYSVYASAVLALAALVVLGALIFEAVAAARQPNKIKVMQRTAVPA